MTKRAIRNRRTAGQTLVLGCVTLLMMALMLMLSFNLTNAIHEKMRLQTHSDVMAYSTAVMEARSFNYFAYTNRASAALLVAQSTLHAYMSGISMIPAILKTARNVFFIIAAIEFLEAGFCPWPCCNVQHCIDAAEAIMVAFDYGSESDDMGDKVADLDQPFNQAVEMLQMALGIVNLEQQVAVAQMMPVLLNGQGLEKLKATNAVNASDVSTMVGALNLGSYMCAIEGTDFDSLCINGPASTSKEDRARVMADVANASRSTFPRERMTGAPLQLFPTWIAQQKYMDIQDEGFAAPIPYLGGTAGVAESACEIDPLNKGTNICSKDNGLFVAQWRHAGFMLPYDSMISSGDDPAHEPDNAHGEEHDKFKGVQNADGFACVMEGNCFINFRSSDEEPNYNQPVAFAAHELNLRLRPNNGSTAWEVNSAAKIEWSDDRGGGVLNLAPNRAGKAISKAQVYFHRFDDWKFPPNMFDPYWRAKLHPFTKQEALTLTALFDSDAAAAAALVVEGE